MKIENKHLPVLLGVIGRALGEGKDLILSEKILLGIKHLYAKIGEEEMVVGKDGKEENLSFTDEEIKEMEETFYCQDSGDEVDLYYCRNLCPERERCNDKR